MNWIETANVSVDPLEVEGVIIKSFRKLGIVEENGNVRSVEFKVYQVGVVTRSGRIYNVGTYKKKEKAQEVKEELTKKIQRFKVDFFNDTWERLIAVLDDIKDEPDWINKNMPAEV